jgi:hypothetical protein
MKKLFFLSVISIIFSGDPLVAQEKTETNTVTIGYGFLNLYARGFKYNLNQKSSPYGEMGYSNKFNYFGPFFLKYDHLLKSWLSIGGSVNYFNMKWEERTSYRFDEYDPNVGGYTFHYYSDITKSELNSISAGIRVNFHIGKLKRIDPYYGVGVGYTYNKYSYSKASDQPNGYLEQGFDDHSKELPSIVYLNTTFGTRFYLTKNIGFYAEIGFDRDVLGHAGLAVKF